MHTYVRVATNFCFFTHIYQIACCRQVVATIVCSRLVVPNTYDLSLVGGGSVDTTKNRRFKSLLIAN